MKVVTTFNPTQPMSTYLFAFSIMDGYVPSDWVMTSRGVKVRSWSRPQASIGAAIAAAYGADVVDYYERFFGLQYSYSKLEFVAEPEHGFAEEDWGQITFRESQMLMYPDYGPAAANFPTLVVAHEIAHQWSGDLVTCAWWSDIWLNEGFAR